MTFPRPKAEAPAQRFEEATAAARDALEKMIAAANEAGWGTEEISVAFLEAARFLNEANRKDPDPADDPVISEVPGKREQIGHGELFD
ncbi:hypothetical protein [Rhizobium phaseoli]|uniref:Hypothetical conserved protein n=1 Tax=Rhizobium etli (strain CIAT 652) TaxID=491916 RepID=B3Q5P3_RHIE6|nr:hypothetical protein [Rhizobium phaseoli]ACE94524.1 hypothetical conserved protein [Rhizobium etli CIAT 652]MDH6646120.1 hypothetical protein [Rhizobium esperanzae]ANL44231.1 hypothetical protein AMC88_PD00388 [Rhizobium phaseoli]ANL63194.1 hypothetical protein AMC85_PD00388 [Rhizobium phaseoli]ANM07965.1 hypothetical protein AMC78_PD00454 [Rhizobium phaseoli]